jgi:hypothetical protein
MNKNIDFTIEELYVLLQIKAGIIWRWRITMQKIGKS